MAKNNIKTPQYHSLATHGQAVLFPAPVERPAGDDETPRIALRCYRNR